MKIISRLLYEMYPDADYLKDEYFEELYKDWFGKKESLRRIVFGGKDKVSFNVSYKLNKKEIHALYVRKVGGYCDLDFLHLMLDLSSEGHDVASVISSNIMPITFRYKGETYQKGIKITTILKKIIENKWDKDTANRAVQKYSNVIQNTRLNETVYISTLPEDILTMSYNTNGWDSCMSPSSDTEYKFGMIEYLNSTGIAVAYTKSSMNLDDGVDNKKWRSLIEFNTKDGHIKIDIKRPYPTKRDKMVSAIYKYLSEQVGTDVEKIRDEPYVYYEFAYRDTTTFEFWSKLEIKDDLHSDGDYACPFCGEESGCACMRDRVECGHCGRLEEADYMHRVDNDYLICEGCLEEEFFYCDCCGEVAHDSERFEVGLYDYFCQACYDNLDEDEK